MNRLSLSAFVLSALWFGPVMAQEPRHSSAADANPPDHYGDQHSVEETARSAIWNSPEMVDARKYVLEYSERSAQSSRAQGEQYLRRVSLLSSTSMQNWLQQLQMRRGAMQGQQDVAEAGRQLSVEQATQRLWQSQQAGFNAQRAKAWIATYWQLTAGAEQQEEEPPLDRKAQLAAALEAQRLQFDPFAPATDPVSPDALTRYAAAAALPGDLPRGDPANFSAGDGATSSAAADSVAGSGAASAASALPTGE